MTDRWRLPDPLPAIRALPPGSAVVAREIDALALGRLVRALAPVCRARRLRLLVAGDWRLAAITRSGGLHLPEAAIRAGDRRWRRVRRPGWLVTAAAHSPAALRRAAAAGVDMVLLAPAFATASHPGGRPIGALRFARWAAASPVPVLALGGLDGTTARRLSPIRVAGFAAVGALTARPQGSSVSSE